ncbi:MAG: hypothetical protein Q4G02_02660 [bacterium]|nr:hypothetical protein [bacterium]
MNKDWQQKKLQKIAQKLKAKLWQKLDSAVRERQKAVLLDLDENYTNNKINFDEYKQNYFAVFLNLADYNWWEHFFYWEVGNFLTDAEKFTLLTRVAPEQ